MSFFFIISHWSPAVNRQPCFRGEGLVEHCWKSEKIIVRIIFIFSWKWSYFMIILRSGAHTQSNQSKTMILESEEYLEMNLKIQHSRLQQCITHQIFDLISFSWQIHISSFFQDLKLILCQIKLKQYLWRLFDAYESIWSHLITKESNQ